MWAGYEARSHHVRRKLRRSAPPSPSGVVVTAGPCLSGPHSEVQEQNQCSGKNLHHERKGQRSLIMTGPSCGRVSLKVADSSHISLFIPPLLIYTFMLVAVALPPLQIRQEGINLYCKQQKLPGPGMRPGNEASHAMNSVYVSTSYASYSNLTHYPVTDTRV